MSTTGAATNPAFDRCPWGTFPVLHGRDRECSLMLRL